MAGTLEERNGAGSDRRDQAIDNQAMGGYKEAMRHQAEYRPTWKSIAEYPPPHGTKVLLRTKYGTAIIGVYYPEGEFKYWCGLPTLGRKENAIPNED